MPHHEVSARSGLLCRRTSSDRRREPRLVTTVRITGVHRAAGIAVSGRAEDSGSQARLPAGHRQAQWGQARIHED